MLCFKRCPFECLSGVKNKQGNNELHLSDISVLLVGFSIKILLSSHRGFVAGAHQAYFHTLWVLLRVDTPPPDQEDHCSSAKQLTLIFPWFKGKHEG